MRLDWELCGLNQNVLTRIDNRRAGAKVEIGLNSYRRASCPISLEDPARELAESMSTVLRATLRGPDGFSRVLAIARVTIPEQSGSSETEGEIIYATDSLAECDASLVGHSIPPAYTYVPGSTSVYLPRWFYDVEQSQIMWTAIDEADVSTVVKGTAQGAVNRDRTYPVGKPVGEVLLQMSEAIDGPDFEFEPIVRDDGVLSRFNTFHPRQGFDRSAEIVFAYGKPPFTATEFNYAPGGLVNRAMVAGAPIQDAFAGDSLLMHPGYVAEHAASIAEFGVFEEFVSLEDVNETATLEAHAKGIVAAGAYPTPFFTFATAYEQVDEEVGAGVPPAFGRDYWIGDTIGLTVRTPDWSDGDDDLELTGRITDAEVTELDSGQLAVRLTCSPEISDADVTGEVVTVLQPGLEEIS
jgi:hypothetical protein